MRKYRVFTIAILLAVILVMGGCSSPAPAPAPSPSAPAAPTTAAPKPAATTPASTTPAAKPSTTTPASPSPAAAAQKFNLSFTNYWPETSTQWKGSFKPILDEITQKSGGRITWTTFLGGSLGGGNEIYDVVKTGKADVGATGTGYYPGRFPMHDVFTLPGAFESSKAAGDCALALFDRILSKEFPDTHPLSIQQTQTFFIYTAKKPVKTLEDMKGIKIRAAGGTNSLSMQALGATGVQMDLNDLYLSLQTGLVDGAIIGPTAVPGFKLHEVLRYAVRFPISHGSNAIFVNNAVWAKIPPDLQQIMAESARKFAYSEMDLFSQDDPAVTKLLADRGGSTATLSPEEHARWVTALKPVVDKWIADQKTRNVAIDDLLKIVREETKKRNIPFPY